MVIDRNIIQEFNYDGTFYTVKVNKPENGDLLGDEDTDNSIGTSEEIIVLETKCDIQKSKKMFNDGTIMADYDIYFPLKFGEVSPVQLGCMFRCLKESYGININGRVVGFGNSLLGKVEVNIKMSEV